MYRMRAPLLAKLVPVLTLVAAGCDAAPTAPAAPARLNVPAPSASFNANHQPFEAMASFDAPADCLGGTLHISGPVTGWYSVLVTSSGHVEYTEHDDFSQLTASMGDQTWSARPGSHEIWSWSDAVESAQNALRLTHEGRTRFLPDDGNAPTLLFIHRIHELILPSGVVQFYNVTFGASCIGPS